MLHRVENARGVFSEYGNPFALASDRDGNFEIYVMDADGSNPVRLTNTAARDFDPAWSPVR